MKASVTLGPKRASAVLGSGLQVGSSITYHGIEWMGLSLLSAPPTLPHRLESAHGTKQMRAQIKHAGGWLAAVAPCPRDVRTGEDKVRLGSLVLQQFVQTIVDEVEPIIVPMPTFNGGLIGDHTEQKSGLTEGPHGCSCTRDQAQFTWLVDVAVEAHVQHAVAVEERDGRVGSASWERTACVNHRAVHAPPPSAQPLRLVTRAPRVCTTQRVEDGRSRVKGMAGATVESIGLLASGMLLLGLSLSRRGGLHHVSLLAWPLVGLGFFLMADGYWKDGDPVLTVMLSAALPASIGFAWWEWKADDARDVSALRWLKGAVALAGLPYLATYHVPWLSKLAIVAVASQSAMMLRFSGAGDVRVGETYVSTPEGQVLWQEWEGNIWFWSQPFGDYPIQTDLVWADGTSVGVNIVLACTALQSMIVFVGAIAVLDLSWKRRLRALLLTLPLIHVLNIFRNAGIVWLHAIHGEVEVFGLQMFEFAHTYAARVVALLAMYGLALVMFRLLPELHNHVLRLMRPVRLALRPGDAR